MNVGLNTLIITQERLLHEISMNLKKTKERNLFTVNTNK
jgi:hypothetical protein